MNVETKKLYDRRQQIFGAGAHLFYDDPIQIERSDGVTLFDNNDKPYMDLYNNIPCVGHANPHVVRAIHEQASTLNTHSRYLNEGVVAYAERLVALHHKSLNTIVFTCSGTEANEVAIMMARGMSGGQGIICSDYAYHGNSTLVSKLSFAGQRPDPEIRAVRFPQKYRPIEDGLSDTDLTELYLDDVKAAIQSFDEAGIKLAGMLICPIFANEGVPEIPGGYMARAAELVRAAGGYVISDEVQAGFCRSGRWWGYEFSGFVPDIATMGKPMGNGVPLAGAVASRELVEKFRASTYYFNTFAASPLQAAAGNAVLDVIEQEDLLPQINDIGEYLRTKLREIECGYIGDIRGPGLFIGIDWVSDIDKKTPDPDGASMIVNKMKDKGFLFSAAGAYFNVLKVRPPLVFKKEHADKFLSAFKNTIEEIS